MIDFTKLLHVQQEAHIDEDGFLSFNPKHGKAIGIVRYTNLELDCPSYDVSTLNNSYSYNCGPQSYTIHYEISVIPDALNDLEIPKKETKIKPKIKKQPGETQEEFSFLDLED